jgi:hypothetical protein
MSTGDNSRRLAVGANESVVMRVQSAGEAGDCGYTKICRVLARCGIALGGSMLLILVSGMRCCEVFRIAR